MPRHIATPYSPTDAQPARAARRGDRPATDRVTRTPVRGASPLRAHAEALRGGPLPPRDPGVPQLRDLLRAPVMMPALGRSLRAGCEIDDVRVTEVNYRPGAGATVAYDVGVAGGRRIAVATAGDALCGQAARTDARRAVAPALGGGSPVARPPPYDVRPRAGVPGDPPGLALPAPP